MNDSQAQTQTQQSKLLQEIQAFFGEERIDERLIDAFLATPRHKFAHRFEGSSDGHWIELSEENLSDHLVQLYQDSPLCIYRNKIGEVVSTISQPSLVLYMIQLLELQAGMTVFELGGGSGWHAALMARLVGPNGKVHSAEIIKDLVENARITKQKLGINNLELINGDATKGLQDKGPFDRGVFTASARELPPAFFEQIKEGGLLQFVLKLPTGSDMLCLLRKKENRFESEYLMPCSFVPVTGGHPQEATPVTLIESLPLWPKWQNEEPHFTPFADMGISSDDLPALIEFCQVVCTNFIPFDSQENDSLRSNEFLFGINASDKESLTLITDDQFLTYGPLNSLEDFLTLVKDWLTSNKPEVDELTLEIYPKHQLPFIGQGAWLIKGSQCFYRWTLPSIA
ncbi:protein-L-isoaspartate O-methyltransferase [Puniceicoccaceae bacterium K14]|nr:protein-L-isoaspartate O-methyltransferase [Puniceicoccaceae bacterium K14]